MKLKSEITDTHHTPGSLTITDDLTMTGVWTPLELVPGEASYQEVQTDGPNREEYTFSIQAVINSDRKAVTVALADLVGRELMVIAQDKNDNTNRLLGETGIYEYHATLTYTQVKEKKPGRNAYDITITCSMHHPAYYYEGAVSE